MVLSAAVAAAFGLNMMAASAQEGGPCTDDIANLKRELGTQVGVGAPVSQPDAGQQKGPNAGSMGQTADTTGTMAKSADNAGTASDKQGDRVTGGSPGTVGGVAGPVAAATGGARANAVAKGAVATSPADVRAQSENKPTAAEKAARGDAPASSSGLSAEDRVSQAKTALQRATDLNAKGDQSCRDAVKEARNLMPQTAR